MFNLLFFSFAQSNGHISLGAGDHYQERLSRIESDKESLVLQVPTQRRRRTITRSTAKQMFHCTEIRRRWTLALSAGECVDRPGGRSGGEDSGPGLVFGRAQGEAQRHGGDAAAGVFVLAGGGGDFSSLGDQTPLGISAHTT